MSTECPAFTVCEQQFANRILKDLGVCQTKIDGIIDKLCVSATTYNNDKSKTTLANIANDLYDCLRPTANDIARITADELSKTFIWILIITAIFILIISIVIILLDNPVNYWWAIIIAIIFSFLYIGLVFFISSIARTNISNNITNAQNSATDCVNKAVVQLTNYENDQQTAISEALCAYSDTALVCL